MKSACPEEVWTGPYGVIATVAGLLSGIELDEFELRVFLAGGEVIDIDDPEVVRVHSTLVAGAESMIDAARRIYYFVRDQITHSMDAQASVVTLRASEVLRHRTGLCYAKSHLAVAMLRRSGIPAGLAYQLLDNEGAPVLHGLVAVYIDDRWHRLDVRGEKPGVHADFALDTERLAYSGPTVRDLPELLSEPAPSVIQALCATNDLSEVALPSSLR